MHPFHRLMLGFYVAAGVFNFSTAMLCLTTTVEQAMFWWRYFNSVAWFSIPPLLVAMTAFVTGRRILAWPAGLAVGTSVLCLLTALIRPELYIAEFHQFKFGLGPITTPVGNVLGALPQLTGIALAAGLLLRPVISYPRESAALADLPAVLALDLQQFGLSRQEVFLARRAAETTPSE